MVYNFFFVLGTTIGKRSVKVVVTKVVVVGGKRRKSCDLLHHFTRKIELKMFLTTMLYLSLDLFVDLYSSRASNKNQLFLYSKSMILHEN